MTKVLTRRGHLVDLAAPEARTIKLTDIALALSRLPRFGGHTSRTWSVADHSLLVADLVGGDAGPDLQMAALLHDAHEAYVGDIIQPLQAALQWFADQGQAGALSALDAIKTDLDVAIARAFALDPALLQDPAIEAADTLALAIEAKLLMDPAADAWPNLPALPDPLPVLPRTDQMAAQNRFLIRALTLLQERHGVGAEYEVRNRVEDMRSAPVAAAPEPAAETGAV